MVTWDNLDTLASFQNLSKIGRIDLKKVMSGENGAERVKNYSIPMAEGLVYNYAAKQVDDDVLEALVKLAEEAQLSEKFEELYNGAVINTGENRLVLHQLTRGQLGKAVVADGVDKRKFYVEQQQRIADFANKSTPQVRSRGTVLVKNSTTVVHFYILLNFSYVLLAYPMLRGAILHSDRGTQYTSELYRNAINKYGILQSMNSAGGRCHDNARCESMWARFKEELLYGRYDATSMTVEQLKTLIWRYFISYWNNRRICSANGGLPPMVKRQQYYTSLQEAA